MATETSFEVGIIGAGIMGEALLAAISNAGIPVTSITIADKRSDRQGELQKKYDCSISNPSDIALNARNIFLVVKPQDIDSLLEEIGKTISTSQRVISFAAGIKTSLIEGYMNGSVPVIRVMPNTPMSVGGGASAISAGKNASASDIKAVEDLLSSSGKTIVVDESLQDAVTATRGSGPAYVFRFI